jgi:hypothetical protein
MNIKRKLIEAFTLMAVGFTIGYFVSEFQHTFSESKYFVVLKDSQGKETKIPLNNMNRLVKP